MPPMSNLLLYALSSLGTMGLDRFNDYFYTLYRRDMVKSEDINIKDLRNRAIRALDSLGYCEFDFDKRYVSACDSAIVSLPCSGIPRAIITGARTEGLIDRMHTFEKSHKGEISIQSVPQFIVYEELSSSTNVRFPLPDAILIEAAAEPVIKDLASYMRISKFVDYSPSAALARFSTNISELKESMNVEIPSDLDWPNKTFDIDRLSFKKGKLPRDKPSLVVYTSPIDQHRLHVYWKENIGHEVDRDWGRYLVLYENGARVVLYDKKSQNFAIPATVPLPRLLARAVTMCSGRVATSAPLTDNKIGNIMAKQPLEIYSAVPAHIAYLIAEKLGQEIIPYKIDIRIFGE